MGKKDFYVGLLFLLLTGAIIVLILRSPSTQDFSGPGPFFFPTVAAVLIGGLSLTLLVKSVKQTEAVSSPIQGKRIWGRTLWIIAWCAIYGATIEKLGYLLSTGMVTFALLAYFSRGKWVFNIVLSVATPILIYILFDTLLKVSMPKGFFGF
jgi:hypothetical protein